MGFAAVLARENKPRSRRSQGSSFRRVVGGKLLQCFPGRVKQRVVQTARVVPHLNQIFLVIVLNSTTKKTPTHQKYTELLQWQKAIEHFDYNPAVDWAIELIRNGVTSENVLIVASFSKPVDREEIRPYITGALKE